MLNVDRISRMFTFKKECLRIVRNLLNVNRNYGCQQLKNFCWQAKFLLTGKIPVGGYRKILPVNRGTGNFCLLTGTGACQPTRLRSATSVPVVNPLGRPPPTPSLAEDDPAYVFRPAESEVSALRVRVHTTHRVRAPLAQRSDNAFFFT